MERGVWKMILQIDHLSKYYGKHRGVEHVSLALEEGEIFGLIGPNGAGKSTTIRSVMNMLNKTEGTVTFLGKPLDKNSIELKRQIGYLPGEVFLYEDMKVSQMLDYHQSFYKEDLKERRKYLVEALKVDESKKIEDLSLGNRKKVGIVLSMMHNPKLLILDEPTSGLDPIMQKQFQKLLIEEKQRGTTIIYSTHILSEVSQICDRVGIVRDGRLIQVDEVENLSRHTLQHVTIVSADAEKIVERLNLNVYDLSDDVLKFKYDGDINVLLKVISAFPIIHLNIEEPSIEEIFMHYYQQEA